MLKKIAIRNYRTYKSFNLEFEPGMNILVGDNDAGKSTLLEAIGLDLTLRLRGHSLQTELSPFLFNLETTAAYIADLQAGKAPAPPEIIVDLHLDPADAPAALKGTNNLDGTDDPGIRVRIALNPDYMGEYQEFIKKPDDVRLVPTEYYGVQWLSFAGNAITWRSAPAVASMIDASAIRLSSGADYHMQSIITSHLTDAERVELSRAYRSLRETFAGQNRRKLTPPLSGDTNAQNNQQRIPATQARHATPLDQFPETFLVLSPTNQWRVHDYYQTQSTASDDQLLLERDRLIREQSSLPQAAGKAYRQLDRCFQIASHYGRGDPLRFFRAVMALTASEQARLKQQTGISMHSLVRPTPDIKQLTRAFISIAEAQRKATDQDLDQAA